MYKLRSLIFSHTPTDRELEYFSIWSYGWFTKRAQIAVYKFETGWTSAEQVQMTSFSLVPALTYLNLRTLVCKIYTLTLTLSYSFAPLHPSLFIN